MKRVDFCAGYSKKLISNEAIDLVTLKYIIKENYIILHTVFPQIVSAESVLF